MQLDPSKEEIWFRFAAIGFSTAIVFGAYFSKIFFIYFYNRVYCIIFSFPAREQLTLSMNSFSIYGVYPLFLSPLIVNNRGSSQPSTVLFSINSFIFLFDRTFP